MVRKSGMQLQFLNFFFIGPAKTDIFFSGYFEQMPVYFPVLLGIRWKGNVLLLHRGIDTHLVFPDLFLMNPD